MIGGGELPALLRPLWCFIAVVSFGQGVGLLPAWAASAPTITTLSVAFGGKAVTTVAAGSVVTLTATVMTGRTPVARGQVNFCDATARFCTDIHRLGTAQLTAKGQATLKFRPGVGSHRYKAVLAERAGLGPSASTASPLTVTALQRSGQLPTTTYLESSGAQDIHSLTATVPGDGKILPSGIVSFLDTSNRNAVLGRAALTEETDAGFAGSSLLPVTSLNSGNTVLTADFNGDGIPDLVILGNGILSVLLGNGDGTFTAAPSPPADLPGAIAVGDFNEDGIPDLAVVTAFDEGNSEVLLGNGDGTFTQAGGSFGTIDGDYVFTSSAIAAGDFNGDGKLDLAVDCARIGDSPCNMLLILAGNGDGTFMQPSSIPFAQSDSPSAIAVGDFNGDGQPDLAVTNSGANGVNVFLNREGNLSAVPAIPATGDNPSSIAAADFNGDGKLDLAVANAGSGDVTILLGKGDGTFRVEASPTAGMAPNSIAVGDFNGDGVPDLAVANAGSGDVTILLGKGDGTFRAAASPAAGAGSTSIVVADFNGDGRDDLVIANSADSSATALLAETSLAIATVKKVSPAGGGTHIVEAIYSGDANYDASKSAEASLTVVPPSFSVSGTPVSVTDGDIGVSTLTVTPAHGFTGTVKVECDGYNSTFSALDAPTCLSVAPVTISKNAPAVVKLRIETQAGTTPGNYVEFVKATDSNGAIGGYTQISVTVAAPVFSLAGKPVAIASPGEGGSSTITVKPSKGYSGRVTLKCIGSTYPSYLIDAPVCRPIAPVTISQDAPATTKLSIETQSGTTPGKYFEAVEAFDSGDVVVAYTRVAVSITAPAPSDALPSTPVSVASPGASATSTITVAPSGGFVGTAP